jgi:hypothetical protein
MIKRLILSILILTSVVQITSAAQSDTNPLTPQQNKTGKWGYIDDKGTYRISPQFEMAMPFKDGLALVSVIRKYGFINQSGRPVIHPQYDGAREFSEDLAAVMIYDQRMKGKWGYINKSGRFIIAAKYDSAADFIDGKAEVKIDDQVFIINKAGEIINPS